MIKKWREAKTQEERVAAFNGHFLAFAEQKKDPTTEELASMLSGGLPLDDVMIKNY